MQSNSNFKVGVCVICGSDIIRQHSYRKAWACSEKCRRALLAERNKRNAGFRGKKAGKLWKGGRAKTNGGYIFIHIDTLSERLKEFAYVMTRHNKAGLAFK